MKYTFVRARHSISFCGRVSYMRVIFSEKNAFVFEKLVDIFLSGTQQQIVAIFTNIAKNSSQSFFFVLSSDTQLFKEIKELQYFSKN
jgi:hypothetical protein